MRLIPLLAALLTWAPPVAAAALPSEIRVLIQREIARGTVPSLAVAVARRGEIVWEEAFGLADQERQIAATPHTPYSLASVSKPLTATGLMVLVERGIVELDRPINHYLGEVRLQARVGDPEGATVRQVADHTSGLPLHHHFFLPAEAGGRPPLERAILRHGNLLREPGDRFEYSNLGYGVLEYLIARVSGKSFARFMAEEVFLPLGLEHTRVLPGSGGPEPLAVRYGADGRPLPFYRSDHGGGSALFASAHDLARFGLFHLRTHLPDQTPILPDRAIREMHKRSSRRLDSSSYYGLGWTVYASPAGYDIVRHDGGMPGATATLVLVPAKKLAVAVLANARSDLVQRVSGEVLAALEPTGAEGDSPAAWLPWTSTAPVGSRRPPRRFLGSWQGSVDLGGRRLPLSLRLVKPGRLRGRLGDGPERGLTGAVFRRGDLTAWLTGHLDPAEADAQRLRLSLTLRGDRLGGALTAFSHSPEGLPSALSYWVDLARRQGD